MQRPRIQADVVLPSSQNIEGWVAQLRPLLPGFVFRSSDRYDEVPAYEASREGIEFILFGVPEGEVGNYVLSFSCNPATAQPTDLEQLLGGFAQGEKQPTRTGYAYYSQELAHALANLGRIECEALYRPA